MGTLTNKLNKLDCELAAVKHTVEEVEQHAALVLEGNDIDIWHQQLGHLCEQQMRHMVKARLVTGIKFQKSSNLGFCEGCIEGKMHRKPIKSV